MLEAKARNTAVRLWEHSRRLAEHRRSGTIFFVAGFLYDIATVTRIDSTWQMSLHGLFVCLLALFLMIDAWDQTRSDAQRHHRYDKWLAMMPNAFHFVTGALLSAYTILYFRSASGTRAILFTSVLALLLIANEIPLIRKRRAYVWHGLFSLCLASYMLYIIPVQLKTIEPFALHLALGLAAALNLLVLAGCEEFKARRRPDTHPESFAAIFWTSIRALVPVSLIARSTVIPALILGANQLQLIPPVPLSVRSINLLHKVEKIDETFVGFSTSRWLEFPALIDSIKLRPNDRVYIFVQTFAPSGFAQKLYMRWSLWDDAQKRFVQTDEIPMTVMGGRSQGYRGYTYKQNHQPGMWQVQVQLPDGRLLGSKRFEIIKDPGNEVRDWYTTQFH